MTENTTENTAAIRDAAERFQDRFQRIPVILIENDHRVREGEQDEVLRLVGSRERLCPECREQVEIDENEDGEEVWFCPSCESSEASGVDVDELELEGSVHGWPGAHATLYHYTDGLDITAAAVESGFLVYEHCELPGVLLAIDGGGYNMLEQHWVPLYTALGLRWHESEAA